MRIMTIMGSPRPSGNTAKVLGMCEELLAREHEVDRIDLADFEVKGCRGCDACKKVFDEPGCVQKDDAVALFERMIQADGIIYASPLYCWSFPGPLKAFLDRHYCLVTGYGTPDYRSLIEEKRTALLVTCAGSVENNADLIQEIFSRCGDYLRCEVVGKYIVPFCTTPDDLGEKAMVAAKRMAEDILGG